MLLPENLTVDEGKFNRVIVDQDDLANRLHDGPPYIARGQTGQSQICPQFIRNFKAGSQKPVFLRGQIKELLPDCVCVQIGTVKLPCDFIFHSHSFKAAAGAIVTGDFSAFQKADYHGPEAFIGDHIFFFADGIHADMFLLIAKPLVVPAYSLAPAGSAINRGSG